MPLFGKSKNKAPKAPSVYKDKHLDKGAKPQSLGGGTENEVFKTRYKDKHSPVEKSGYFKEDTDKARAKYGVGASRLAAGMGLGSLIPETSFAEHRITDPTTGKKRNAKGAMSLQAPGESLGSPVIGDQTARALMMNGGSLPGHQEVEQAWTGWSRRGDKMFTAEGFEVSDTDLSAGHTQKQLNQLQWFDALIGNRDRHAGNILVDPKTGNVSGIDNDLSFSNGINTGDDGFLDGTNDKYLGLPSLLDEETANMLLGLSPKAIAGMLNPKGTKKSQKFSDEELQQTYARLAEIQKSVQGKLDTGDLVKQWDQSTYDKQIQEKSKKGVDSTIYGSYIGRQGSLVSKAKDTSNPDSWRRGHRVGDTTPVPQPVVNTPPVVAPVNTKPLPVPPPQSAKPKRPIGGIQRPEGYNALRPKSPNTGRPLPQPPGQRPTGGIQRPEGYNALRKTKVGQ